MREPINPSTRQPTTAGRGRHRLSLITALALLVIACGELERPEAYSPSTSTSVVDASDQSASSQVVERPGPTVVDDFVPTAPADYVPTVVFASEQGVWEVGAEGEAGTLGGDLIGPDVSRAVDDLFGGLVVEDGGSIAYYQARRAPEVIVESGAGLLDVGYWGGAPRAFLQVGDREVDWVRLASTQVGDAWERRGHFRLEDGESLVDLTASGDLQAVVVDDQSCGDLRFFGIDGATIDLVSWAPPSCTFPGQPAYGSVALSPGGDALAYTVVTYRSDGSELATDLVVQSLIDGDEPLFERRIGEELDRISSLSFDGERVAFLRDSISSDAIMIVDLTRESPDRSIQPDGLTDFRSVSFARIQLEPIG